MSDYASMLAELIIRRGRQTQLILPLVVKALAEEWWR